jgi:hypothetical protein
MVENEQTRRYFLQRYVRGCTDTRGRIAENGFPWCLGRCGFLAAMLLKTNREDYVEKGLNMSQDTISRVSKLQSISKWPIFYCPSGVFLIAKSIHLMVGRNRGSGQIY